MENAGITIDQIGTVETHDCFSIAGVLATEALGLAAKGKGGAEYVAAGKTARNGENANEHYRRIDWLGSSYWCYRCASGCNNLAATDRKCW